MGNHQDEATRAHTGCASFGTRASDQGEALAEFGGEFDPGSGSTLAACLMHASRTGSSSEDLRGGRVRTTWAICRRVGDSSRKREVIPHERIDRVGPMRKGSSDSPDEEPASD